MNKGGKDKVKRNSKEVGKMRANQREESLSNILIAVSAKVLDYSGEEFGM